MNFEPRVTYIGPTGTHIVGDRGGAVALGRIVRDDIVDAAPTPKAVSEAFVRELRGRRSFWPAAGHTRNRGPFATGLSAISFRTRQGRTASGRFTNWEIFNDAKNERGDAYAGYVNEGLRVGGQRVSPARYAANYRAVERTWNALVASILGRLG